MKRVSFIILSWSDDDDACFVGGSAKSPFRMIKYLSRLCDRRYVVHFSPCRSKDARVVSCSVRGAKLFLKTLAQNVLAWPVVYRAFKESDVVQCHHPHLGISAAAIKRLFFPEKQFIVKAHGTALPELKANRYSGLKGKILLLNAFVHYGLDRFVLSSADVVICSSRFQEREMADLYRVEPSKLRTVYNGFDDECFLPQPSRSQTGGAGPLRVGFCGRVVPKKNPLYCFDVCEALRRQGRDVSLTLLLGEKGRVEDPATYRAIDLRIKSAAYPVTVHHDLKERSLAKLMSTCDVGLVPSVGYESIPSVIYEFTASGACVFATRKWGVVEILKASRALSGDATADAIRIAESCSEEAPSSLVEAIEVYAYRHLAEEYLKLYESL